MLPSDEVEWARLDKQHSAFLIALGGLYPCPEVVEAVLDPAGPQPKRILDVGCGTGSWAIEMAQRFPHCAVKGVDLAPVPLDTAAFPPNLDFVRGHLQDNPSYVLTRNRKSTMST